MVRVVHLVGPEEKHCIKQQNEKGQNSAYLHVHQHLPVQRHDQLQHRRMGKAPAVLPQMSSTCPAPYTGWSVPKGSHISQSSIKASLGTVSISYVEEIDDIKISIEADQVLHPKKLKQNPLHHIRQTCVHIWQTAGRQGEDSGDIQNKIDGQPHQCLMCPGWTG